MQRTAPELMVFKVVSGLGAEAGQRLLNEVVATPQVSLADPGRVVAFDLSSVEFATTSFVKTSILPLFQSARLSTEPEAQTMSDAFGIPALNIYPVLANARLEVEELADEIFGRRSFPLLSLKIDMNGKLTSGRLVGSLDASLLKTMRLWSANERHTASSLHEKHPEQGITLTAWSNRLNDLWRVRLLRRVRQGKSWIYQPVANGVNYG